MWDAGSWIISVMCNPAEFIPSLFTDFLSWAGWKASSKWAVARLYHKLFTVNRDKLPLRGLYIYSVATYIYPAKNGCHGDGYGPPCTCAAAKSRVMHRLFESSQFPVGEKLKHQNRSIIKGARARKPSSSQNQKMTSLIPAGPAKTGLLEEGMQWKWFRFVLLPKCLPFTSTH